MGRAGEGNDIALSSPFTRDSTKSGAIRFSVRRKNGETEKRAERRPGKAERVKRRKRNVAKANFSVVVSVFLFVPSLLCSFL